MTHMTEAHELTQQLLLARRRPGAALTNFRDVALRQIPDFAAQSLPLPDRVVVTGGTGCIGTVLLQLLTEHGVAAVASISRRPPQGIRRVDGVRYLLADVRDLESLRRIFLAERPDLVIHLAGQRLPALAEQNVAETLSSNVFGTQAVLEAAAVTDVGRVITASTGKALRFFAPEVYAASKKLAEYLVSRAQERWGISCSTVRFTHVVDNSVIHQRLHAWARAGEPICLHAPGIAFYAQSALEAAQLLLAVPPTNPGIPTVAALTDIGWPHDLLDLALDVIDEEQSNSAIDFSGFERGYENAIFPGTYDPLGTDHSPLFNVLETNRLMSHSSGPVDSVAMVASACPELDDALADLEASVHRGDHADDLRNRLLRASEALLVKTFADATERELARLCTVQHLADIVPEHRLVYRHVLEAVTPKAPAGIVGL
jgi:nucleoside-diphosphate-sugar epimerase